MTNLSSVSAIRFERVSRHFGEVKAVDRVDLDIRDGEFFSMLGPSGSGKTTCLRMIAGFDRPTSGHIYLFGQDVSDLPPYERNVNTVFQDYALFPHMTIEENIAYGLMIKGMPKPERQKRVEEMLDLVRLPGFGPRKPSQISGGQRQRVALARALINHPKVLLLDEPLGALDLKLRQQMQVELKSIQKRVGITFIFVTHDQEEALTMSDHIAVMDRGTIVQFGTPMEVYDKPKTTFVANFVGNSNLFQGILKRGENDQLVFECDCLQLPFPPDFEGQPGQRVNLLLRPEHLQLKSLESKAPVDRMGVVGEITFVTLLGLSIEYEVKLESGAQLRIEMARSRDQAPLPEGMRVWVTPKDSASYFTIPI